jgi:hypothetical protein
MYCGMTQLVFNVLAVLAGIKSAQYWYETSTVTLPPHTGDSWAGEGPFMQALLAQSVLNRKAAFSALLAVMAQQFALILGFFAQMHPPLP